MLCKWWSISFDVLVGAHDFCKMSEFTKILPNNENSLQLHYYDLVFFEKLKLYCFTNLPSLFKLIFICYPIVEIAFTMKRINVNVFNSITKQLEQICNLEMCYYKYLIIHKWKVCKKENYKLCNLLLSMIDWNLWMEFIPVILLVYHVIYWECRCLC